MFKKLLFIAFILLMNEVYAQNQQPAFLTDHNKKWVDSIFNALTTDEKIGQLLMPRGNVSGKPHDVEKLIKWVQEYKIGGIVFFAGPPTTQARLTNQLQSISKVPLFIGEDFEWGLAMRMDSTDRFPYQMSLGAIEGNESLIREMGAEIGQQCKRLGVHINYAPVVDVNNNIANPVINFRSFGSDKYSVAKKGMAYMEGLQSAHIIATAKHFPGHGDTDVDSHKDIPLIPHDKERLTTTELYPFQSLINAGISGIMTAHLDVPAFETKPGLAATFSKNIVNDLLRYKMGFKGLTFTDAMDMKGAVKNFPNGEALVKALLAGNDVLETFEDVPVAIEAIKKAIVDGTLPMSIIDEKVRRILMAKSWVGLDQYAPIEINNLVRDLNSKKSDLLNRKFAESFLTLIKNQNNVVPIGDLTSKIAIVSIDANERTTFQKMCSNYTSPDHHLLPINANDSLRNVLFQKLKSYDVVIVGLHLKEVRASSKYSLNESNVKSIELLSNLPNASLCIFGNVMTIPKLNGIDGYKAILACFQNTNYTEEAAAQIMFGGLPSKGKLPLALTDKFTKGLGLTTQANRLSFGIPEQVNINGNKLKFLVDSIVSLGLRNKAFPGAVVQIIKDGRSIFQKAYGFHTYEDAKAASLIDNNYEVEYTVSSKTDAMDYFGPSIVSDKKTEVHTKIKGKVNTDDLYDLASITKIGASALAGMQLMGNGSFDINKNLGHYVPALLGTNKEKLLLKDLLTHRAGLQAWIPFWRNAIDTLATLKMALKLQPSLEDSFIVKITKPSFIKRIFGKKPVKQILFSESIAANKNLLQFCLNPRSIAWKENTFYQNKKSDTDIKLADNLYMSQQYQSILFKAIADSPVNANHNYLYSDLHYYYYPQIISHLTKKPFTDYLYQTYKAIGANSLTYNPMQKFDLSQIAPTEYDSLFRKDLIHGTVHDEGAIMMGGISGHAGLFGNANDLSKLMYLYLNKGSYGGKSYIEPSVLEQCTAYQYPDEKNRRGLFFDKLDFDKKTNGPSMASSSSYGHSGFTGTFTWIDPENNLLYVFLSNRVYPTRENKKISELNIRTEVGNAIYRSMH
jgi:beta-N-acetylhexosaminidase